MLAMGAPMSARGRAGEHGRASEEDDRQQRGEQKDPTQQCHIHRIAPAGLGL